jgi:hypothetical protein
VPVARFLLEQSFVHFPAVVKMVKATVKWGKESYEVELDPSGSVMDFRTVLFSLTGG